jgi:hypothetical protein
MKRTKINYLQKPTFCPPKMRCIFLLLRRQRAQFDDRPSKAAAVCFDSRDTDYAIGTGMDVFDTPQIPLQGWNLVILD